MANFQWKEIFELNWEIFDLNWAILELNWANPFLNLESIFVSLHSTSFRENFTQKSFQTSSTTLCPFQMKSKVRKRKGNNEEKNEVKGSKSKVRLPSWAHERSKRALVELEKKQFVRPKMALNEPMEDIKLIDEADDVIFNTEVDNSKNTINLPEIMLGPKLNRIKAPEALCKHKIFHVPIMKENVNLSSVKLNYIILEGRAGYDLDGMDLNTLANSAALKERKVWNEKIKQEYRMTVFNDMFQTIDVLIEKFNLLLEAKPYGKILIINCYPIECSSKTGLLLNVYHWIHMRI